MTDDRIDEIYDDVQRAAHIVARKWPDVIDADDAEQEIWLRLLENDYVGTVADAEPGARRSVLDRIARQVASQYRDDYAAFSGQISYVPDEVRRMLTAGWLDEARRAEFAPSSTALAEYVDLHEGIRSLGETSPTYAEVIGRVFLVNESVNHPMKVTRAIDALTREMNRVSITRMKEGL